METLSRRDYRAYVKRIDDIESGAAEGFAEAVEAIANAFLMADTEDERSVFRDLLVDKVYDRIEGAQSRCHALADDMFKTLTGMNPSAHDGIPIESVDRRVRSAAGTHLFSDMPDVAEFSRVLGSFIEKNVRGATNAAMEQNVIKNHKNGARYALIPHIGCICEQCLMVASFGFHYKDTNWSPHGLKNANCTCRLMPGKDGQTKIEGYSPEDSQKKLTSILESRERFGLTEQQMRTLMDSAGYDGMSPISVESFEKNMRQCMDTRMVTDASKAIEEAILRDPDWLFYGTVKEYEVLPGATPKPFEIDTALRLCRLGMPPRFKPVAKRQGIRSCDAYILDRDAEFKSPEGCGSQTIYHQFEEAAGQSEHLVIDLERARGLSMAKAIEKANKTVRYRYKTPDGEIFQFKEVLIIDGDDAVRILR